MAKEVMMAYEGKGRGWACNNHSMQPLSTSMGSCYECTVDSVIDYALLEYEEKWALPGLNQWP